MAGLIRFVDYSVVVYFFGQPCIVCLFLRRCFGITWKKRTQRHLLMSWYRPVSQGRNTETCDGNNPKNGMFRTVFWSPEVPNKT